MNKVFEYMMLGIPIVQFDLKQARSEAGGAALVASSHGPAALADAIIALADDPGRRHQMAETGRAIAGRDFQWPIEAARYISAVDSIFAERRLSS
jgi:glycosyltransferase involved in cell wall biosynthesis